MPGYELQMINNALDEIKKRLKRLEANDPRNTAYLTGDDGIAAPSATLNKFKVYTDTADGELKVIFGDGEIENLTGIDLPPEGPTFAIIPLASRSEHSPSGIGIPVSFYFPLYPYVAFDRDWFPASSTVQLVARIGKGTTSQSGVRLYNVTSAAAVTGSEVLDSSATELTVTSGDFRANLSSGVTATYRFEGKMASGTLDVYNAYLLVRW